jgi:hypothetical protein
MATAVRISEKLVKEAKKYSRVDHRSVTGQNRVSGRNTSSDK